MYQMTKKEISVKTIAKFLNAKYEGKDFKISKVSSLNKIKNNSLLFYSDIANFQFRIKDIAKYDLKKLEKYENILLITTEDIKKKINVPIISSKNPRLDFQRVIMKFFIKNEFKSEIHKTAIIENNTKIGKNVHIGSNCYIGNDVEIGDNTRIFNNTCIFGKAKIGRNTTILSNASIGTEGYGFSFSDDESFHFPHVGSTIIGDNVWIGSNSNIEKSQIDETIIEDNVKIDALVQIGHNSIIKKSAQLTAGTIICGRAKIGRNCWIAPNSVVDAACEIGDNSFVGTLSLVKTNFPKNSVIVGSPAKLLRKNL